MTNSRDSIRAEAVDLPPTFSIMVLDTTAVHRFSEEDEIVDRWRVASAEPDSTPTRLAASA